MAGGGGAQDGGERAAGFAFQSPVWGGLFSRTLLLRRVHRQADPAFVAVLNEVRQGRLSAAGREFLTSRATSAASPQGRGTAATAGAAEADAGDAAAAAAADADDRDTYVWLGSHKKSVASRNEARLARIDRPAYVYAADDWSATAGAAARLSTLRSPAAVALKVGARVICVKNVAPAAGVVNGAAGVVVDFREPPRGSRRDADGGLVVATPRGGGGAGGAAAGRDGSPAGNPDDALPLLTARAIADIPYRELHGKCVAYRVDVKALPNRKAVVLRAALTRQVEAIAAARAAATAAAGTEPPADTVSAGAGVTAGTPGPAHWPARAAPVYPFVRFDSGTCALLLPTADDLVDADGVVVATRTQLPLTLGWALTVHGAQGMSLARVEVDLSVAFEAGMVYVALSRATSADGLRVASLNLDRDLLFPLDEPAPGHSRQASPRQSPCHTHRANSVRGAGESGPGGAGGHLKVDASVHGYRQGPHRGGGWKCCWRRVRWAARSPGDLSASATCLPPVQSESQ